MPLAYCPIFSAPDPTVKRKTGFLMPSYQLELGLRRSASTSLLLGAGARLRCTFTPMITTKQGPLLQGEWRQRLIDGAYTIRGDRHLPARQGAFLSAGSSPGYRDLRGSIETSGQFAI